MPLIDDLRGPIDEAELSRRRFLLAVAGGALSIAGAGAAITGLSYLRPNVLFEPPTRFAIGRLEQIATGAVLFLARPKLFVVRTPAGCHAMSAVCTHLGCVVKHRKEEGDLFCPCHGSQFDLSGNVKAGPAPRPLPRYALELEGGKLVVDVRTPAKEGTVLRP